jgi:hypothetical protein
MKKILALFILTLALVAFADSYEEDYLRNKCGNNCLDQMHIEYRQNDRLSLAEQMVIQIYTEVNRIDDLRILLSAANKLPSVTLKSYRGGNSKWFDLTTSGQTIVLNKVVSVSMSQMIAENFVDDQLLIINAISARDISKYSVIGEQELLLLPGVALRVDNISFVNLDLSYGNTKDIRKVRVVELTEI